ncbi:MAG: flavin-containing monooxygenase [Pseudobdellovibrio sp.]
MNTATPNSYDVIIVGAGFAGLYSLYKLKKSGLKVGLLEEAPDLGGTWYWNKYPGAQCDVESVNYSYGFSDELDREWSWQKRFAEQTEIQQYLRFVTQKFDLKSDMSFNTKVITAEYNEADCRWRLLTEAGVSYEAQFCVMATGCLSKPYLPNIEGLESFKGEVIHTARWPDNINFTDKNIAVIGTGASGVQIIPELARVAKSLTVFQRTPNYCVPVRNRDQTQNSDLKQLREKSKTSYWALPYDYKNSSLFSVSESKRNEILERAWEAEGLAEFVFCFRDIFTNDRANKIVSDFIKNKIRQIVTNEKAAHILSSMDYPLGSKRICGEAGYYESFNLPHVSLVDLKKESVLKIDENSVKTTSKNIAVDIIVMATGFDAMTGALTSMDIRGRNGISLKNLWSKKVKTYLGMNVNEFPNLFLVMGPGSPSVLINMVRGIEQNVNWISDCIQYLRKNKKNEIEAQLESQDLWSEKVISLGQNTFINKINNWYNGANIENKVKQLMLFTGGYRLYDEACQNEVKNQYSGFKIK